ncbi:MAG: enoyl-CoA hydratase/isomerase family protein [Candidatus Sulfotelmatobacter sp.]
MATMNLPTKLTQMNAPTKPAQIRVARRSPAYWRVTIDNPQINVMGPEMVKQFQEVIGTLEADERVRVVVFDSAVDDYFLNHSDFTAKIEDLTSLPEGPTGLPPWPDFLVRLTRLPVASIALIRGRATGNGSEITLACDMSFASREKAIISQWEVGVGMVAGGGPMARLPRLIGRNRALEVLLSSEDIRGDRAEAYGSRRVNHCSPESPIPVAQQNANSATGTISLAAATIRARNVYHDVEFPVAIEVSNGKRAGVGSASAVIHGRLERPIAIAQQDAHAHIVRVGARHHKIGLAISVYISDRDRMIGTVRIPTRTVTHRSAKCSVSITEQYANHTGIFSDISHRQIQLAIAVQVPDCYRSGSFPTGVVTHRRLERAVAAPK